MDNISSVNQCDAKLLSEIDGSTQQEMKEKAGEVLSAMDLFDDDLCRPVGASAGRVGKFQPKLAKVPLPKKVKSTTLALPLPESTVSLRENHIAPLQKCKTVASSFVLPELETPIHDIKGQDTECSKISSSSTSGLHGDLPNTKPSAGNSNNSCEASGEMGVHVQSENVQEPVCQIKKVSSTIDIDGSQLLSEKPVEASENSLITPQDFENYGTRQHGVEAEENAHHIEVDTHEGIPFSQDASEVRVASKRRKVEKKTKSVRFMLPDHVTPENGPLSEDESLDDELTQTVSEQLSETMPSFQSQGIADIQNDASVSVNMEDDVSLSQFTENIDNTSNPSGDSNDKPSDYWDISLSDVSLDEDDVGDIANEETTSETAKRPICENGKAARKSASKESTVEQPKKKKFSGRIRKRRQVSKVLLEAPDIDLMNVSIKDIILLGNAKERKSRKDEMQLKKELLNKKKSSSPSPVDREKGDPVKEQRLVNYHSHMTITRSPRWSKSETEKFYEAIRQFGTDFLMIEHFLGNRTRDQVKLKFKNEERKHPVEISEALSYRSKDVSGYEEVIRMLNLQKQAAEEKAWKEEGNGGTPEPDEYADLADFEVDWGANESEDQGLQSPTSYNDDQKEEGDGDAMKPDDYSDIEGDLDAD